MPQPGEPDRPGPWERVLPDPDQRDAPSADHLSSDLAHLFDYCRARLGQDAESIRTARSVLDSAHEPPLDRDRLRAWLFGLARSLAVALRPADSDEPSYLPAALVAAPSQRTDTDVLRAFRALTDRDREILDLVYRHGIRPADLPAVLIVPAEEAYRCLVNAEGEFISLAAGPKSGLGADLEDIAALPLAALPTEEGNERQLDGRSSAPQPAGAALQRPGARRRTRLAAATVIPVAAIVGGVMLFAAPGHPATSNGAGALPGGAASPQSLRTSAHGSSTHGSPHAAPSGHSRHSSAPGQPVRQGPVTSPTATPEPASSPSGSVVTGLTVTVQPVPCPAGTKANFRWHYAANGSAGGWSGTATHSCPGSVTMGPQAMGGNLQISPGTTLEAGYDFTLPGNNKSLTMTVSAAQVTFAVSCVSKAAPSAPTLTVPLQAQTYQITNAQWYPSGDQSSPLVYQGSVPVPALCGPGGEISLAKGGTFTATLG